MIKRSRLSTGSAAAAIAAVAGGVAFVAIVLFFAVGEPFGTVNDIALVVMTLALLPVWLAHYELGGIVPLWLARLSLTGSAIAVVAWALIMAALIFGLVTFDYEHAATGVFAASSVLQIIIGLWIAGASLLAGSWLSGITRSLGIVAGVGTVMMSVGLLLGGVNHSLSYVGGIGYQVVLPVWAWFLARVFRQHAGSDAYPAALVGEGG